MYRSREKREERWVVLIVAGEEWKSVASRGESEGKRGAKKKEGRKK